MGEEVQSRSLARNCTCCVDKYGKDEADFRKTVAINIFCFAISNKTVEVNWLVCRIQLLNTSFPSSSGKCFALWYLGYCNIALHFCSLPCLQSHFLHLCSYFCHPWCLLIFHSNSQQKHQRLRGNLAFSTGASLCRVFCLLIIILNKQNPDKRRGRRGCSR